MVETLLWAYIFICATLILFNVGFMLVMAVKAWIERRRIRRMRRWILRQLIRIAEGKALTEEFLRMHSVLLIFPSWLVVYDRALAQLLAEIENGEFYFVDFDDSFDVHVRMCDTSEKEEETVVAKTKVRIRLRPKRSTEKPAAQEFARKCFEKLIELTAKELTDLTSTYRRKDEIIHTYYAAFLRKYGYLRYVAPPALVANMKDLVEGGGVFACEHVLQAIYTSRNEELVYEMLKVLDEKEDFVHPKIVSDGLLSYKGGVGALQRLLLERRKEFSVSMQVNIITYLRFASDGYCEPLFEILQDVKEHDEIRFACMRYFGKHRYEKAFRILADCAKNAKGERIEYCVVALTALRNYPSQKTFEILRGKLNSPYWFVRYNAAESLEVLGIRYDEMVEIFDGTDRFAREMIQYQFDQRYAENKEKGL